MQNWATLAVAATLTLVSAAAFAQAQQKIAVVDMMKVANECKEGKKIQATLKDYHDKKQGEISAKEADLKALEDKSKDPKISDAAKDDLRNQFTQKMYEYQAFAKAAQDEMESRSQKMQHEFQGKLAGRHRQVRPGQGHLHGRREGHLPLQRRLPRRHRRHHRRDEQGLPRRLETS